MHILVGDRPSSKPFWGYEASNQRVESQRGRANEKKIEVLTRTVPNIITWDNSAIMMEESRAFNF